MSLMDDPAHLADLYTRSETTDASGGQVVTYTLRNSGVGCQVRGASANERLQFLQQNINVSHVITTISTLFQSGDKVVTNGLTLRVVDIYQTQAMGSIDEFYTISCGQLT